MHSSFPSVIQNDNTGPVSFPMSGARNMGQLLRNNDSHVTLSDSEESRRGMQREILHSPSAALRAGSSVIQNDNAGPVSFTMSDVLVPWGSSE